jgi:hypothetical protein
MVAGISIISCSEKTDIDQNTVQHIKDPIELTPEEIVSIAYDRPTELSEAAILAIAKDFPLELQPGTKANTERRTYKIDKKMYLGSDGELTSSPIALKGRNDVSLPIYAVNVAAGTTNLKAYICADERIPEVIAYVPSTDSSKFDINEHPLYLHAAGVALDKVNYYNKLKDSLRTATLEKIKKQAGDLSGKDVFSAVKHRIRSTNNVITKSLVVNALPTLVINKVGPFTTTRWDQGWDFWPNAYNHKMLVLNCDGSNLTAPAGCVTVAVAQLLAHHTPAMTVPTYTNSMVMNVDWALLKQSPGVDDWDGPRYDLMGSLMRYVAEGMQSTSACSEGTTLTSAGMDNAVTFVRRFLNINNLQNFSTQVCKASLDNLKLVLASGSRSSATGTGKIGHAWVVDGYAVCRKGTVNGNNGSNDIVNKYDMYLHCNLGWGSSGATGWYLVNNDWTVTFDTGNGADPERQHYRLDLRCAPYAASK